MINTNPSNFICSDNLTKRHEPYDLCVILPAYNEGNAICRNLLEASGIIGKSFTNYQLIAVNDGSSDNTFSEIKRAACSDTHIAYISYEANKGKGNAITTGVSYANSSYTAFLDSDLELPPDMLIDFYREMQSRNADIVIGSKLHPDSQLEYPAIRRFLSMGYYFLLKLMFRLKIKDTQTGIKMFKSSVIIPICDSLNTHGYAFDIEILAKAAKKGYSIIEMPVRLHFNRSRTEKSRFSIKTILNIFKETIRIKKALKDYR